MNAVSGWLSSKAMLTTALWRQPVQHDNPLTCWRTIFQDYNSQQKTATTKIAAVKYLKG
ncbi:hypothetical protein DY78_GL001497 [Lactiplantibacillus fabifermentans DSM 21115]|uniref:Uncharacterized protein n=1 Tax=Lactiplantibacillus fabifermentans DSM 21115 TaxID=1413187 RepID=A0A0R2NY16_9LACO|nr:hypothetical protein DY78_GL001497 [Lactiplantibacillus fabifermentans DSM 21115]